MQDNCKAKFEMHDSASRGTRQRQGKVPGIRHGSYKVHIAVLVGCMVETNEC